MQAHIAQQWATNAAQSRSALACAPHAMLWIAPALRNRRALRCSGQQHCHLLQRRCLITGPKTRDKANQSNLTRTGCKNDDGRGGQNEHWAHRVNALRLELYQFL